jgi:hypothetical protein
MDFYWLGLPKSVGQSLYAVLKMCLAGFATHIIFYSLRCVRCGLCAMLSSFSAFLTDRPKSDVRKFNSAFG